MCSVYLSVTQWKNALTLHLGLVLMIGMCQSKTAGEQHAVLFYFTSSLPTKKIPL